MTEKSSGSSDWIESQVLRATSNSLLWNGISIGCLLVVVWLMGDYFYYFFRGPATVSDAQLLQLIDRNRDRSLIEYVELKDRILIPTEWKEVTTRDGKPYSSIPYFLLPVGERMLLPVQAESQGDGKRLVGPLGSAREMDTTVVSAIVRKHPEYDGRILPIVLHGLAAFNVGGYVLLVLLVPWGAYCGWNVARAVMARVNPSSHSIERQLSKFGDASSLAASINQEMSAASVQHFGKAILTDSWVLRPTVFGAICVRLQDVVWAFQVLRSTECFAVLYLRTGKISAILLRQQQVEDLVREVSKRAPWALIGYDLNRLKQWRKDRAEIIRQSDERRDRA